MPRGNSLSNAEITRRIEQARDLLDEVLVLTRNGRREGAPSTASAAKVQVKHGAIDFSMPIRAFVKKYGTNMSGPKKFTLMVAYLTKGDATKRITLAEIERYWNKMTAKGLLGMKFNRFYASQAKENDWANTEKTGAYHLRPAWKEIFQ